MSMVQINHKQLRREERGFALLMTLIVVTIVIAIGLTVLDLSTKQVRLAANARDSEIAFHAANAGMECARYWRNQSSVLMESGAAISPTCFTGGSLFSNNKTTISSDSNGAVYKYDYSFTWAGGNRCSEITTLVASAVALGSGITISNMNTLIPGYPGGIPDTKTCNAGERCTVLSVRGYNKPCGSTTGYGTVQREVLLQF